MSRTHLYRATPPPRPFASLVLAGGWIGGALTSLLGTTPALDAAIASGAAVTGPHDRLFLVVAVGGVAVGLLLALSELAAGRTRWRAARLGGAVLLAGAGGIGALDTARAALRPVTPIGSVPEAIAAEPNAALGAPDAEVAAERLLWTTLGLAGAGMVLVGGLGAARHARIEA